MQIDAMLIASGWLLQDYQALNLSATAPGKVKGRSQAHQLFGEQLPELLDELNEVLAA